MASLRRIRGITPTHFKVKRLFSTENVNESHNKKHGFPNKKEHQKMSFAKIKEKHLKQRRLALSKKNLLLIASRRRRLINQERCWIPRALFLKQNWFLAISQTEIFVWVGYVISALFNCYWCVIMLLHTSRTMRLIVGDILKTSSSQ